MDLMEFLCAVFAVYIANIFNIPWVEGVVPRCGII